MPTHRCFGKVLTGKVHKSHKHKRKFELDLRLKVQGNARNRIQPQNHNLFAIAASYALQHSVADDRGEPHLRRQQEGEARTSRISYAGTDLAISAKA